MANLSYRQPKMPLANPPRWLVSEIFGHESYVTSVTFFGENYDRIVSGSYDEVAKLWDLKTKRCLRKFIGHTDGVTVVMQGPDGRVLTASEDRTVRMWDGETGECVKVVRSHSGSVTGLCMAGPDRIVTGSTDKKLRIFDAGGNNVGEAELVSEIMAVASAATAPAAPPSRWPAKPKRSSASSSGSIASPSVAPLGKLKDGENKPAPSGPRFRIFACGGVHIPTPARPMLRSVDVDPTATSTAVAVDNSSHFDMCTAYKDEPDGEEGVVSSVAVSAAGVSGSGTLIAGCYDKAIRVLRNVFPAVLTVAEVVDADCLQSAGAEACSEGEDGGDGVASKAELPHASMEILGRHADGVRAVAISANGRWGVSGSRDGHIKVWEIASEPHPPGAALQTAEADFEAHHGVIFSLCMSPDARILVSGGSDRCIRVWDLSLVVNSRRLAVNRARALWSDGRIRRARAKRSSSSSANGMGGSADGSGGGALKAFNSSREQRQHIFEGLFALPEIIYAKVLMYL